MHEKTSPSDTDLSVTKSDDEVSALFCNTKQAIAMSPFGKNHFYEAVLKDPRFPKPLNGDTKKIWSRSDLVAYWKRCAKEGFPEWANKKSKTSDEQ